MKKFVIVMISLLVLFVFLIVNYLLWDKENLLKQRDTDKVEQDWLRGQNRTLQTTVEDLEQSVEALKDINDEQKDKIVDLEQKVRLALQNENSNLKEIQLKHEAIGVYKSFMSDKLKNVAIQWFARISKGKLEESYALLDKEAVLWGKSYDLANYTKMISAIEAISAQDEVKEGSEKPFAVLYDSEPYTIKTQIIINMSIKEAEKEKFNGLETGSNTLDITFFYNKDIADWVIKSVDTLKTGKP